MASDSPPFVKQLRSELKQIGCRSPGGRRLRISRCFAGPAAELAALRIVYFARFEHCDRHSKQAVGDTPERSSMVVPGLRQAGIVEFAKRVVLNGTARPVVHRISKLLAAASSHHDLFGLPLAWSPVDAAMRAQSVVVALGDWIGSLRQEIRRDEEAEPWKREQDPGIPMRLAV